MIGEKEQLRWLSHGRGDQHGLDGDDLTSPASGQNITLEPIRPTTYRKLDLAAVVEQIHHRP